MRVMASNVHLIYTHLVNFYNTKKDLTCVCLLTKWRNSIDICSVTYYDHMMLLLLSVTLACQGQGHCRVIWILTFLIAFPLVSGQTILQSYFNYNVIIRTSVLTVSVIIALIMLFCAFGEKLKHIQCVTIATAFRNMGYCIIQP